MYYQNHYISNSPEYFKTTEYNRLMLKKKEAFQHRDLLNKIIDCLIKSNPDYDYRIVPFLGEEGTDVCYIFEILLNKNSHFYEFTSQGDEKTLLETGGLMKTLTVYISILGSFFTYRILNLWLDSGEWQFNTETSLTSEHEDLWETLQKTLSHFGYKLLDHEIVNKKVPNIFLETVEKDDVILFDCLFSELFSVN